MKFNPSQYDFLWKVGNMDFPLVMIWLTPEVTRRDFIVTGNKGDWKVYIGKNERKKLGQIGLRFVLTGLPAYQRKVHGLVAAGQRMVRTETRRNLRKLTNAEVKMLFLQLVRFGRQLWSAYFLTEYFCYDEVNRRIQQGTAGEKRRLLRAVHRMQRLKFRLRQQLNQAVFGPKIATKYLVEIAQRLRTTDLGNWHYDEIADALVGKTVHVPDRSTYIFGKFNGWRLITGSRATAAIKSLESSYLNRDAVVLHGQIGNRGHYRGRVKIIPFDQKVDHAKYIADMKKGQVLVSGSTGPEMILACKKAGAIVTEEGGIISHAATISRELGIPCVIGTKIATEVLKDGDLVDVDAEHGVVRKLKYV